MPRIAFRLKLQPGAVEEYEEAHRNVWPELLAKLRQVGIRDYSIFRRAQDLFLVMRVEDFNRAWDELDKDPVNQRWQKEMSRFFAPVGDLQPGERFAMMKEIFYLD
jgi:L-rhamnose mutarotase